MKKYYDTVIFIVILVTLFIYPWIILNSVTKAAERRIDAVLSTYKITIE